MKSSQRTLKPSDYIDEFYPDSGITKSTVINWIKKGVLKGTRTPTGRYLVVVKSDSPPDKTNELVQFLEA